MNFINNFISIVLFLIILSSCKSSVEGEKVEINVNQFKIDQLAKANNPDNLVLFETQISDFIFEGNMTPITDQLIQEKLSFFNVEVSKNEGYDESGPIVYYTGWKGYSIFSVTMKKDNIDVKNFAVQTTTVVDQYGVSIGMTYDQVLLLRTDLEIQTDPISNNPLLISPESNIYYEFCCYKGPLDAIFVPEDFKGMKIQSVLWKSINDRI